MNKKILCTLGPNSLNERTIKRLEQLGAFLFRINLSHTKLNDVEKVINTIRLYSDVPICLDSEGAQIRTAEIENGSILANTNEEIKVVKKSIIGGQGQINFHPVDIIDEMIEGDMLSVDFNTVLAQVVAKKEDELTLRILNGGIIGENKAVTVDRPIDLPALSQKDIKAFTIGVEMGIKYFALSFANRASDIEDVKKIVGTDCHIISKIECTNALINLKDIVVASDSILIDRGDLSREQPIERIPILQKHIVNVARANSTDVFVATNLLESMIEAPIPTRAEVNDVYNTLADGADGLVLAAETAIGKYPIQTMSMVVKIISEFENCAINDEFFYKKEILSFLVAPHGGKLVYRAYSKQEDISKYKKLKVKKTDLSDCEQIALGTYSPLEGFLCKKDLEMVLTDYKLSCGTVWTLPILLQNTSESVAHISVGDKVVLVDESEKVHSILEVEEKYSMNLPKLARDWFGTNSNKHPGVKKLIDSGNVFLGGKVSLIERLASDYRSYELTPIQSRLIFTTKGWSKVVGFHTRNVPHEAHKFIQLQAMDRCMGDGLLISPVIGEKNKGDFTAKPIIGSYEALIQNGHYPENKVVLGAFSTYSRYCGPREAVFTAICRKNMGCSHFIIGRDHTGIGDFYGRDENYALFKKLGDIGIVPIFFDTVGFNPKTEQYEESKEGIKLESISGTEVRRKFREGSDIPSWLIHEDVQTVIRGYLKNGIMVFF